MVTDKQHPLFINQNIDIEQLPGASFTISSTARLSTASTLGLNPPLP